MKSNFKLSVFEVQLDKMINSLGMLRSNNNSQYQKVRQTFDIVKLINLN